MAITDESADRGNSDPNVNPNDYGDNNSGSTQGSGDHHYHGGTDVLHAPGILSDLHPFVPPPVPGGNGSNGTSVSTPSLDLFATNIDLLIQPVRDVATGLADVAIAPGAFYHANVMRTKVNGPNADAGLKKSYGDALSALVTGLTDLRDGVKQLSHDYGTTEEANAMTATDLADALGNTANDFNTMMTSNGGTGMTGTGNPSTNTPAPA
ncbi:hypothetical protein ACFWA4_22105 [Streptomyces sp. NPDC060011]|uniref:hypothetical protein n=1 Tax=unclassified Streptomyces TaxID=2593676 RepID=UPI0013BB230F|nr:MULTISPECIES: hypothetical protein [unclassified Streptomyces]MCX5135010.1 hypothetical protein [Streptomyces sp. NBC_00340]MCX5280874.1 hypothetical protein [Streptomyces sp. NBC_00198]NEB27672.1 hypothetical protein [Streptomyces sp. SID14446]WSD75950.1 hypothetical protein OHB33_06340 [Streptomyces sp. NBC_01558]